MPSSVAWDGMSALSYIKGGVSSSWIEGGRNVPSLAYGSYDEKRGLVGLFEEGLSKLAEHPEAIIPVERFRGRLLMLCGNKDKIWPSCAMMRQVAARAACAGRPAITILRYPDAGHGVMGVPWAAGDREMRRWGSLGGTPASNAAARADSWPKVVAFLKAGLKDEDSRD